MKVSLFVSMDIEDPAALRVVDAEKELAVFQTDNGEMRSGLSMRDNSIIIHYDNRQYRITQKELMKGVLYRLHRCGKEQEQC
jgi:hypothetical protein